ncbi:MAG: SCO family protein [Ignavibacteriae bacterium]|nr:SCO family protein [Ignavibacteriota bacterium]MCB9215048.1 SCO family protein [Ignavibacteria bacterium]
MRTTLYSLVSLVAPLVILVGCADEPSLSSGVPYFNEATLTPLWVRADSVEKVITHRIGDFSLQDQDGEGFTQSAMEGKITVVDFFFTSCPGICPILSKNMARIQDSLKGEDGLLLLSYSVTPEADSVPILKKYAEAQGAIEGTWYLLTGNKSEIYGLARESFFANVDTGADAFLHTELFYLIDEDRHIRGVYNGTLGTDVVRLVEDIRMLRRGE